MIDIIGKKWWFFAFSAIIIVPGILSLVIWGIKPGIDFTGGTLLEFNIQNSSSLTDMDYIRRTIDESVKKEKADLVSIQKTAQDTYLLRMKPIDKNQNDRLKITLSEKFGRIEEMRFETVGPTIGAETAKKAVNAIIVSSLGIILYIAFAFRKIPKPYSSLRFGMAAVFALIHDVFLVLGIFSLLGHFFSVEIDSLFITALLTIMGFSVHDSIVVFDRIRENLIKMPSDNFGYVVNVSLVQTLARSLSTSLTVILTLFSLLIFGGETIRWFIAALLIGIISGTYSSIFNAAPLLVIWENKISGKKIADKN